MNFSVVGTDCNSYLGLHSIILVEDSSAESKAKTGTC